VDGEIGPFSSKTGLRRDFHRRSLAAGNMGLRASDISGADGEGDYYRDVVLTHLEGDGSFLQGDYVKFVKVCNVAM
jgi:hypothetical protein